MLETDAGNFVFSCPTPLGSPGHVYLEVVEAHFAATGPLSIRTSAHNADQSRIGIERLHVSAAALNR